jgi:hypothetical protein
MNRLLIMLGLAAMVLGGCGIKVVPLPTATAIVNPADNSLVERKDGVTVTARVQDLEVAPYRMVDNVTSFHIAIENGTEQEIAFPLTSFILLDGQGRQYRPIEPAEIQKTVGRDSAYLIPYPYVGYYYLEDKEKSAAFNTFESSLPFYAENYPQDLYTQALPAGTILPGAKVSGLVYFLVELSLTNRVELRVYRPGTLTTGPADYVFPFSIEEK